MTSDVSIMMTRATHSVKKLVSNPKHVRDSGIKYYLKFRGCVIMKLIRLREPSTYGCIIRWARFTKINFVSMSLKLSAVTSLYELKTSC